MLSQALLALLALIAFANAHSWIEQLTVIAPNGTFVGVPGYARGNFLRTAPGFNDTTMTYLIPPDGATDVTKLLPSYKMCKDTQQKQTQTEHSPRLQASAGAAISLRYQENGHVTLPQNQPGKPPNRGTVYVYGTTEPRVGETLLDVYKQWNTDGTGGDKRGVLLSKQDFDDSRCYQINTGNISEYRQQKYPHKANQLMGADLWCQQDIRLPSNAPSGKPYTLYWVWDWPTTPGVDPTYPHGKKEIYTTCMDIDVVNGPPSRAQAHDGFAPGQNLNEAAIPSEFADLTDTQRTQSSTTSSGVTTASTGNTAKANLTESTASLGPKTTVTTTITSTTDSVPETQTVTETVWQTTPRTMVGGGCQATGAVITGN